MYPRRKTSLMANKTGRMVELSPSFRACRFNFGSVVYLLTGAFRTHRSGKVASKHHSSAPTHIHKHDVTALAFTDGTEY